MFKNFDLILLDLDGLLVNTEELHWKAYQEVSRKHGYEMNWAFPSYFASASRSALGVRERLEKECPSLFQRCPWEAFYKEKSKALEDLLYSMPIPLMEGAEPFLEALFKEKKEVAVVTHSAKRFIDPMREKQPVLQKIVHWFPKETYEKPKPAPDGWLAACRFLHTEPAKAIGFEDTLRGIDALVAAGCRPVFVNGHSEELRQECRKRGIEVFSRLDETLLIEHSF